MKNSILFILTVFLTILLVSCNVQNENPEYRLLKMHYENSNGEKGLTTFSYKNNGNIELAIWELKDGSRNSLNYHKYNDRGNLIEKYREFSDSLTSSLKYTYDKKGNLQSEHFTRSDGIDGTASYEYNTDGKCTKANCNGLNGWFFGAIEYVYNKSGNKVAGTIYKKDKPHGNIIYTYDKNGNLIKEHWVLGKQFTQTLSYEYDYFNGKAPQNYTSSNVFIEPHGIYRLNIERYKYGKDNSGTSFFNYNKAGKLTKKAYVRNDGLSTSTTYLYDSGGNLTKSYRKYSNGKSAVFTYQFNKKRKLISRTFLRTDGVTGSEKYKYNNSLHLISAELDNFDSWLTGEINFIYNTNGRLESGKFTGSNNFDADIIYSYNKNNELATIHWDFSFNKTQDYKFEYKKLK